MAIKKHKPTHNAPRITRNDKTAAVILAAGEGKRMKSALPKVLHPLADKPLLEHVVDAVKGAGVRRIVVVVSADRGPIEDAIGPAHTYVVQKRRLGTGHALMQARKALADFGGDVVVLCGDAPLIRPETLRSLIQQHRSRGNVCTVLTAEVDNPKDYGRIVRGAGDRIERIVEEQHATAREKAVCEVNSGVYCLTFPDAGAALSRIQKRPPSDEYPLTDIVGILLAEGGRVEAMRISDGTEITGINSRKALARAEKIMQRRLADCHMENGVSIVDPDTTFLGCRVQIGRDTRIEPFSVIEGRVRIGKNCVVGPFAHLRDGTVLKDGAEIGNFVEVKKSTVGAFSKAKHLSYLGDATIGRRANIGAGTITANYDGKHKHPTTIGDGASIGSNTTLVAPVSVGAGAVTGAGSVVLKGRDVRPGWVVAGVPARVITNKRRRQG